MQTNIEKYNSTMHSSTGAKPVDAHEDEKIVNVKVNRTLKQKHFRKYLQLNVGDEGKYTQKELVIHFKKRDSQQME